MHAWAGPKLEHEQGPLEMRLHAHDTFVFPNLVEPSTHKEDVRGMSVASGL